MYDRCDKNRDKSRRTEASYVNLYSTFFTCFFIKSLYHDGRNTLKGITKVTVLKLIALGTKFLIVFENLIQPMEHVS